MSFFFVSFYVFPFNVISSFLSFFIPFSSLPPSFTYFPFLLFPLPLSFFPCFNTLFLQHVFSSNLAPFFMFSILFYLFSSFFFMYVVDHCRNMCIRFFACLFVCYFIGVCR